MQRRVGTVCSGPLGHRGNYIIAEKCFPNKEVLSTSSYSFRGESMTLRFCGAVCLIRSHIQKPRTSAWHYRGFALQPYFAPNHSNRKMLPLMLPAFSYLGFGGNENQNGPFQERGCRGSCTTSSTGNFRGSCECVEATLPILLPCNRGECKSVEAVEALNEDVVEFQFVQL